jgi:tetratricopeptide (TPR) repeat protein
MGNTPTAVGNTPAETTPIPVTLPKKSDTAVPVAVPATPAAGTGDSPDNPIVVTNKPAAPAGGGAQTPVVSAPNPDREQLDAIAPLMAHGDQALDRDEVAVAISYYRQAVDGAPLLSEPRLKLAKAYLQGGFEDKALDEAKRALLIAPNSVPIQEFLIQLDANGGTASGTVTLYQALTAKNPQDISAHIGLGDAYWNAGSLDRAEAEYKTAENVSPKGDIRGATQLVRLYAAQARYGDVLPVLKQIGARSYPIAARVIHSRLDTLISTISSSREAFDAGKSSHEQFYDTAKTVSAQAAALADFVDKVQPPAENRVSHLHLSLAASLIAQEAEVLRTFIETSDPDNEAHAVELEKSAQTEILTAHAAEQKAGLFVDPGDTSPGSSAAHD